MALRLLNWKSLLLNLGAGVFLCASIGCGNTRGERGPNLNAPVKTMGSGNQVLNSPSSPAYNNLAGAGNGAPAVQNNNFSAMQNRGTQTQPIQNMQVPQNIPAVNNPQAFVPQNQPMGNVVVPPQYPQQGLVPSGYPIQQPTYPQQQTMQPMYPQQQPSYPMQQMQPIQQGYPQLQPVPQQQPPLMQLQGPAMPMPNQGLPTSMNTAPKVSDVMPVSLSSATPTLEPAPSVDKTPTPRVLAEYNPAGKRTPESPVVVTTPIENQPVLEAPVTYPK